MDKIIEKWQEGDEGVVLVLLFLFGVVCSAVPVFGILMPYLISAKSTIMFIMGVLTPVIYPAVVYGVYRIFFVDKG